MELARRLLMQLGLAALILVVFWWRGLLPQQRMDARTGQSGDVAKGTLGGAAVGEDDFQASLRRGGDELRGLGYEL
jgi:hypothetical protein